jgi:hypothetical protein
MLRKKPFFVLCLFSLSFLLSGCEAGNLSASLRSLDENLGRTFGNFEGSKSSSSALDFLNKKSESASSTSSAVLTAEQKKKIDEWLEKKGLNKYGDSNKAFYTNGTPLFDEKGRPIERYEYILNKFPNILELIKKGV